MQNVEYNGEKYQLFASHENVIQSFMYFDRKCFKIRVPWKSMWKQVIKLMEKVLIMDSASGEVFHCRIVKLSDKAYGDNAYVIAVLLAN